jgi:predicted  nucleic acid-binding Zn-ribbon protein
MVAVTLALQPPLFAQQSQQEGSEPTALQQSLDQIVVLLRQLVDQSARRDRAALLLSRIELAERRLAPVEKELQTLRQERLAEEREQVALQSSFQSIDDMEKMDVTGSATEAFEAERQRVSDAIAQKELAIVSIDQQISALETAIAEQRWEIEAMDEALRDATKPSPEEKTPEGARRKRATPAGRAGADEAEGRGQSRHPGAARRLH